jgi:(+)-abscisic acid 8'-hydroxylase
MLETIELVVLAAAPWPLYRALAIPPFRRFYTCFAIGVLVFLVVYALAAVLLAIYLPALLHAAAILAIAILCWERWRARSDYGKAGKLPPGSLALVPREPWIDHRFYLKQAKENGPVFKASLFFRPMICVVGADQGHELLREHGDVLRAPPVRFNRFIPGGFLRYMEGDDHARYRKLFQAGIARSVLQDCAESIESDVRDSLDSITNSSENTGDLGVNPRAAFREMLLSILLRLFFGISKDAGAFGRLCELYEKLDIRKAACGTAKREIEVAREIAEIVKQQADSVKKRSIEGTPAPASFLAEILKHEPNAACDDTVILNLVYMVQVARTDMTGLLMWVLKKMSDNFEAVEQLRLQTSDLENQPRPTGPQFASAIVKETLRLDQSEYLYRKAQVNIQFKGFAIPKGWLVRICIREGHRNPKIFPDPERFDPHRFVGRIYGTKEYSPLGLLGHSCLGAQLVDLVGRTFVTVLANDFDWRVVSDGPREFAAAHWATSSKFRINLRARQPKAAQSLA